MLVLQSLVFGLLICLLAFYANFCWGRRRLYYLAARIPGPRGLPMIGCGHKFLNKNFKQMLDVLATITNGYKSITSFWLGPEFVVYAETPESLKNVLNSQKCLDKSSFYETFVLNQGLLINGGNMWRAHRRILNPAFSLSILQKLVPLFNEKSKILSKNMEVELGRKAFDVYAYLSACSLETLLKGTMNMDRDVQSNALQNEYVHCAEMSTKILMKKVLNVFYMIEPIYRLTKLHNLEQKYYHNGLFKIADEVLENNRQVKHDENDNVVACEDIDGYPKKHKNFIDTLLDPKSSLSESEIWHEINTLIAAGHETSALILSDCVLMLAMHPDVQQKVVEELFEVFGSSDKSVDAESLNKLVYLEIVLKEVMRLFPVVPFGARKATEEFDIDGYTIPVGAHIVIPAYKVQRSPEYWGDDAHLFKPERFEPENFKKIQPYAYIPFSGGPRICIGWRYGMMFMKTVLVNLLSTYKVSTPLKYDELEYEIILTMKIVQNCMITVEKR